MCYIYSNLIEYWILIWDIDAFLIGISKGGISFAGPKCIQSCRQKNSNLKWLIAIWHLLTKKDARASSASFFVRICVCRFQFLYLIVEMEGLEPSSKQATWVLSTCLVFIWFSSGSRLKTIYFQLSFSNFERLPKLQLL